MDLKSTYCYWPIKNGLVRAYPALNEDIECDVVVVGGGITGALVAYHLAEAGVDTVVLDRREFGWGSTSATTALLQYEIDTPLSELVCMVGKDHAVRSYTACLEAIYKLGRLAQRMDDSCGFEFKKSLYLASAKKDVNLLRAELELRCEAGIRVDWLDQPQLEREYGLTRPAALLSHDAAQVDAYQFAHQLLHRATQYGARVFDRTAVTQFEQLDGGVMLSTDRTHTARARKVAFAAGYESQQYLKRKVATLISTFAFVSEPVPVDALWRDECLIWESAEPYIYLRTTEGEADHGGMRRVIMGGEDEDFRNPQLRDKLIPYKTRKLLKKFQKLFPDFGVELEAAFAWAGTFGKTKDGLAYIGAVEEFPNAYFALGYGGNGITYSAIAAEIVRDAVLGKTNSQAELFLFDR